MQTFIFDVRGMTRGGCAGSVESALGKIDSIGDREATLRPGLATMKADSARVTVARIEVALGALGHAATLQPTGHTTAVQPKARPGGVASRWTANRADRWSPRRRICARGARCSSPVAFGSSASARISCSCAPPRSPEDLRYTGSLLEMMRSAAPGPERWLGPVFDVVGGFMVATGAMSVLAAWRSRAWPERAGLAALSLAGEAGVGLLSATDFVLGSALRAKVQPRG